MINNRIFFGRLIGLLFGGLLIGFIKRLLIGFFFGGLKIGYLLKDC